MNSSEKSILSFIVQAVIKAETSKDFTSALVEFKKSQFSDEFNEALKILREISSQTSKHSSPGDRAAYFDDVVKRYQYSQKKIESVVGEAIFWALKNYEPKVKQQNSTNLS
jgi:nitrogen fixation-related uncharacterized protein